MMCPMLFGQRLKTSRRRELLKTSHRPSLELIVSVKSTRRYSMLVKDLSRRRNLKILPSETNMVQLLTDLLPPL